MWLGFLLGTIVVGNLLLETNAHDAEAGDVYSQMARAPRSLSPESGESSFPNSSNSGSGSENGESIVVVGKKYNLLVHVGLMNETCLWCCPSNGSDTCTASNFITEGPNTLGCRCDNHCVFFEDCCEGVQPAALGCNDFFTATYSDTNLSLWSCQSLYPETVGLGQFSPKQVGVYAVSVCPSSWFNPSQHLGMPVSELSLVGGLCSAANSTLPLVSDALSGRVYRNEYCALCHEVAQISLWLQSMLCSGAILDTLHTESRLSLSMIRERCGHCVYASPPTVYSDGTSQVPRSCSPALSTCPKHSEYTQLEAGSGLSLHDYLKIVDGCTKQTELVSSFSDTYAEGVVFRNSHCATCNMPSLDLQCYRFDLHHFPFCKSHNNGTEVEIVLDAVLQIVQILNASTGDSILRDVPLDIKCPPGQILDFVTHECRTASCLQFDHPTSDCTVIGLSDGGGDNGGVGGANECSEELVLDNPSLYFSFGETTFYYIPLFSIVLASYTNVLGFPVVCIDSAVPVKPLFLEILERLTFIVTILSIIILAFVGFVYLFPSGMRSTFGLVVANFAFASLLSDLSLLLSYWSMFMKRNHSVCIGAGSFDHSMALCQFFWLFVFTFFLGYRYLRRANDVPPELSCGVLGTYYAVGWCLPVIITSFEVAFVFATHMVGSLITCFQFSSILISSSLYLVPAVLILFFTFLAFLNFLWRLSETSMELTKKDKMRFVVLGILILIMIVSFLVRLGSLLVTSSFAGVIVGYLRLVVIVVRTGFLAVVLLVVKKLPKALQDFFRCGFQVHPASAEVVELAELQHNEAILLARGGPSLMLDLEMKRLAEHLQNPAVNIRDN